MFEYLFSNDEITRRKRTKFKIILAMLEDVLNGHEIVSYIRRLHEYLVQGALPLKYKFYKNKITIKVGNQEMILEAFPSFNGFYELIFQYIDLNESRDYRELKGYSFTDECIFSTEQDITTTKEGNRTTIKKNREDRAYIEGQIVYRNKGKKIEEKVRDREFVWEDSSYYFINGTHGFKGRETTSPLFEGKEVTRPDFIIEPYFKYMEIHDVKQMSFYNKMNWEEPYGVPIDEVDYLEKLKDFRNQLDFIKGTDMLKLQLDDEVIKK